MTHAGCLLTLIVFLLLLPVLAVACFDSFARSNNFS